MKTLLVTGGAGFIASEFVAQAVSYGHKVVVLDALTYAGHRANLEWIPQSSGSWPGSWQLIVGSITDGALVSKLLTEHNVDAVLNFAAESHVDNSIESPGEFINTNIIGVYTMLEASRNYWQARGKPADFRFIQVSTDEVFGSLGETGKFHEEYPMQPNSPYSASKAAGDHLSRAWFETYGLPTIVTNCTNNYGPRQYPEKLIPLMITNALNGKALPVYGDGKNIRDWINVHDHCAGIYLALTKGKPGETYCFGGNAEKNNIEVVTTICAILDELSPRKDGAKHITAMQFVKDRLGHDRRYAIDDSKAERELGYAKKFTFESGIRDTVKWYLENQAWCETVTSAAKKKVA
jgi:dTDP-glucose 4,6-dehydratase